MSSNPPAIATSSKAPPPSGQLSPAQTQPGAAATSDSYGQRRSGGSSFGAGAATRSSPTPRNAQQARKQHKNAKRVRVADDDAIAESVSRLQIPVRPCDSANACQLAMRPFNSR